MTRIRGALAAGVTPLRDGGTKIDADAFGPLYGLYAESGLDGVLVLGTTGEGILLSLDERRLVASLAIEAAAGALSLIVHAGAQTTADTVALAAHAAEAGADGVAVIGPPYFALDETELLLHFDAAAAACAPTPFYLYEFAARSGYAVPPEVIRRLRESAPNLVGLKVSDQPMDRFEPYLIDGLDIFVGPEGLINAGLSMGAVGAVSGLAGGFPEVVVEAVRTRTAESTLLASRLRAAVSQFPFQAALKSALSWRNVPIHDDVRAPLRKLDAVEIERLRAEVDEILTPADLDPTAIGR